MRIIVFLQTTVVAPISISIAPYSRIRAIRQHSALWDDFLEKESIFFGWREEKK